MAKFLIVKIAYEKIGGIDRQILRITKEIGKRNIITPCLATSDRALPLAIEFKKLGYPVYEVKIGKEYSIFQGANSLVKVIRQQDISFIQSHLFRESLVCRLAKLKHQYVKHIFRAQTYIDCAWIPEWQKILYHFLDKISSGLVDKYIANGEVLAKELYQRSFIPKRKVAVVINGCEQIGSPDKMINDIKYYLPKQIALVSNLLTKKGHDVLIRSLAILKKKEIIIKARIIGDEISGGVKIKNDSFKQYLIEYAKKYDVINQLDFYGYTENIYQAIKDVPVIVLPSDNENVPNCILEAMSVRKIIVASNVGAIPTFINNRVNGFLNPPQDEVTFASILEEIFKGPAIKWEKLRDAAISTWKNNLSLTRMINGLLEEYSKIGLIKS